MDMSSSASTSAATDELKNVNEPKPIKLRSACNCCFAAKVRCDGNKEGCKRCVEKHLDCTYSESMVGKVVGKRRKRPLPDSQSSDFKANPWNAMMGSAAMPSPAPTYVSDQSNKRNCVSNDWANLISYDEQSPLDFSGADEQLINLDLCQEASSVSSYKRSFKMNAGLPTPSMSPPETQYLSPTDLETCSYINSSSAKHSGLLENAQNTALPQPTRQYHYPSDDDETLCIRLLAHLKRLSHRPQQSAQATVSIISRTNATIRRILQSPTIRTDYMCQLLLTNIAMHLAAVCEQLSGLQSLHTESYLGREFLNEWCLTDTAQEPESDPMVQQAQVLESKVTIKTVVNESAQLCSCIGDLLKRKPLNGFQVLGRQESALIEVGIRLKQVMATLT